jgi:hypothetical protein
VVDVVFSGETVEVAASAAGFLPTAVRIGSGRSASRRLVVDPDSDGMRALTTGIGR